MNKQEAYNKMIEALTIELYNDQLNLDNYEIKKGNGVLTITTRTSKVPEPSNDNTDFGSAGDWNTANGWYTG
ncbi:hypothetical protein BUY57_10505 [Staphylococcus epidermidis]|uniref:hypothetical protein n=1 Tax=Staphylococcus epidermidis TaxID=1282 RepID=UPI000D1CBAB9|nr:hypothetical protein [Staphylococcus epidermidis]PTE62061.1 hypothetical protein BUY57_10505 [Staphylococcus epidermidis]